MFVFNTRELLMLTVALLVTVALGVWAAFGLTGYLAAHNLNAPLAKVAGLSPLQERGVDTKR